MGLSLGNYTVDVKAVDKAGNSGMDSVTFTIAMMQKPTVSFSLSGWAIEPGYLNTTNITLVVDITASVQYTLKILVNGTTVKSITYSESISGEVISITVESEGIYNITVMVEDTLGNKDAKSQLVYVDLTAPSIEIISPSADETITSTRVEVRGTVQDNLAGIYNISIRLSGQPWVTPTLEENGTFYYTFTGLTNGDYTVYVKVYDRAGNVAMDSVTFSV